MQLARIIHERRRADAFEGEREKVESQSLALRKDDRPMTDCSLELTLFPLPKKPVVVRNDGGALTSDAGVLLVRTLDVQLGLTRGLARCLPDRREQKKVHHQILELLRQRIYQIACGYEDCNDADFLRSDPALKVAVGRSPQERDLASQPSLSRLENGISWRECWAMSEAFVASYIERHRSKPPAWIVLDTDATDDETHGRQQLRACYVPFRYGAALVSMRMAKTRKCKETSVSASRS